MSGRYQKLSGPINENCPPKNDRQVRFGRSHNDASAVDDSPRHGDILGSPMLGSPAVFPTPHRMKQRNSKAKLSTHGNASIFSTMINLFNTITGAGMLGLPYAFANSGVDIGSVWFLITGLGEAYAIHLLGKCVLKERKYSFSALAKKTLNFNGKEHFVNAIMATNCFGYCCGYLVVCGQLFPDIMRDLAKPDKHSILLNPTFWISIVVWVIAFPLVCLKTLDSLRFTSTLGFLGIVYVSTITILFAYGNDILGDPCEGQDKCPGHFHWGFPGDMPNLLRVISLFCYAFVGTQNVPTLTFELKNRSIQRLDISVYGALLMAISIYFITALAGYQVYGDIVDANLLKSFPVMTYTTIARLGIAMVLCTTFPLQMYPTKNSICNIIYGLDAYECSNARYYGTIVVVLAAAWGIGVSITDLSIILAFIGATTSVFIGYSFPAYFYIKIFANEGLTFDKVMSYAILISSLLLAPLLVGVETYSLVHTEHQTGNFTEIYSM